MTTALFRWLTRRGAAVGSSDTCEFVPEMPPDFFLGMSADQARAGLRQMRRIGKNLAHRRNMGRLYDRLLRETGWNFPTIPDYMDPVLVRYPVRVADKARAVAEAPKHFVELGTWFECPLHPIETPRGRRIVEAPIACFDCLGKRRPVGGGGYFRLWPYGVIRRAFRQLDRVGRPGVVYMHPYEYDPTEMRAYRKELPLARRLHQGLGRKSFSVKIGRLLADFDFGPVRDVITSLLGELETCSRGGEERS